MPSPINKKVLRHLIDLARLEVSAREEEKLGDDLRKILDYFAELQTVPTDDIAPLTGGASLLNVFREDGERHETQKGQGIEGFPETAGLSLKVPAVFDKEKER